MAVVCILDQVSETAHVYRADEVTPVSISVRSALSLSRTRARYASSDAFLAAIAERLIASDTRLSELVVERNITLF